MLKGLILLNLALALPLAAQQVELRSAEGELLRGTLKGLDVEKGLTLALEGGEDRRLDTRRLLGLRFSQASARTGARAADMLRFELANGDQIFGRVLDCDLDDLRISSRAFGDVKLPLERIARVVVLANLEGLPPRFGEDLAGDEDVVFLVRDTGMDTVVGAVERFTPEGVVFEWGDDNLTTFDFREKRVAAVRLAEPEAPDAPDGVFVSALCRDGSRLSGLPSLGRSGLIVDLGGAKVEIPFEELLEIGFRNGDLVMLADLEPKAVEETPYFEGGIRYGLSRDRGLTGGAPNISGVPFSKSLCVHSRCVLRYDLGGLYSSFSSAIGLDGEVAERSVAGAVAFSVRLDGKELVAPRVLRAGEEAVWLSGLDLTGGRELSLIADFADNYHFNAWAVWGSPLIVKAKGR